MTFFECSAKSGDGVSEVFEYIATLIIQDLQKQGIESNNNRAMAAQMTNRTEGEYGSAAG